MDLPLIIIGVFLIVLGIVVKHFKLYFLIAGYNTMTKAEKEEVNIEKVASLLRFVFGIIGLAFIILGMVVSKLENPEIANYVFFTVIIGTVVFFIVKSNSSAYKK
ncbi:DUF3784 domain-containing protein [Aequorivita sp. KMM 9714]|uniref:DUF3784 domain-containing protein n=1 Tax=Aequorivita sp. KMM 9714 TaxID=2707173 RepID=UPI0013EA9E08|nr:DUF3784 domain-containing protein [Aequorivita sp. KMM 9714]NGX82955.1 DUF3784 domain-containing protein [Aequorivita sp. KMM 9714]